MCTHATETWSQPTVPTVALPAPSTSRPTRTLVLNAQESVRIVDAAGRPLCEIVSTGEGPLVQLAAVDTGLDFAGKLRIHADAIEMIARDGELKMLAKDDVIIRGEKVRLN